MKPPFNSTNHNLHCKTILKNVIWGITKSGLYHFGLFLASYAFINLVIYKGDYNAPRDFTPVNYFMILLYGIANYYAYVKPYCEKQKIEVEYQSFSSANELKRYIRGEGKYLLGVYGVLAVIFELALIFGPKVKNLIATILFLIFPMGGIPKMPYNIPVLRSILGYSVTALTTLLVFVYTRYKIYKKWHEKQN